MRSPATDRAPADHGIIFSLIVCTIERTGELDRLLQSIARQKFRACECIVVDQNLDDRISHVIKRWEMDIEIRHLRSAPGLSRARNVGLGYARGSVIAFPDDDCWYPDELLRNVNEWFQSNGSYSILTVASCDEMGKRSGNRWIESACDIRPLNAFRTTFSSTIFVRQHACASTRFDEQLGVGSTSKFRSGEETDFVLAVLKKGARGRFDRTWRIIHPRRDMLSGSVAPQRAAYYGYGMGYVLAKNALMPLWILFLAFDLSRALLSLVLKIDVRAAKLCLHHFWGVMRGYLSELDSRPSRPLIG